MKKFEPPVCEIIIFAANDVIITSYRNDGITHGESVEYPEVTT